MAGDGVNRREIERAVAVLRAGGLVAFPTETVYGLGARALDPAAIRRVFEVKGRPHGHPLIAHVAGIPGARSLAGAWPPLASRLAEAFWPGPLTLVVIRAAHVPLELTGGGDSVGVRAPAHPVALALLEALGEPIAAPSANRYQSISPTTAAHVAASLGDQVDLILDGGPCSAGIESTVVDVRGDVPIILRPGALDLPTLARVAPALSEAVHVIADERAPHLSPGLDARHYAPRTRLVVARSREGCLQAARGSVASGVPTGMLLTSALAPAEEVPEAVTMSLGADPREYARRLFAALHELDAAGLALIVVEPVPDAPAWRAIADRLRRAGEALAPPVVY